MLINVYAGVLVGDSFCPKGFVLLGGKPVYLRILFENSLEKWGAHYIRVHIITSKYGIPTHNMQKAFQHSLEKRELNWNCHLVFSIILKVFLLLDFIVYNLQKRKNPSFFDDSGENSRIIPSHLCCHICAKACQCGQAVM